MNSPKKRMARLVKAKDMDRSFDPSTALKLRSGSILSMPRAGARGSRRIDLLFWKRVGAEGRFAAAWQMVLEVNAIKGKDGCW